MYYSIKIFGWTQFSYFIDYVNILYKPSSVSNLQLITFNLLYLRLWILHLWEISRHAAMHSMRMKCMNIQNRVL